MIPASARLTVAWFRVNDLDPGEQPINPGQVEFYVDAMRASDVNEGHLAPPLVTPAGRIRDGRHRHAAHRALGRDRIRCVVVDDSDADLCECWRPR